MPGADTGQAQRMNILPKSHNNERATALHRVQEATAAHARTRRALDEAIEAATAAGVPPEALQDIGQVEPGHGKHAGDAEPAAPAQFEAFVHPQAGT